MLCTFTHLGQQEIAQVQSLEKELNHTLLAVSCREVEPAALEAEQLATIEELEKKLGVSLVAVKS